MLAGARYCSTAARPLPTHPPHLQSQPYGASAAEVPRESVYAISMNAGGSLLATGSTLVRPAVARKGGAAPNPDSDAPGNCVPLPRRRRRRHRRCQQACGKPWPCRPTPPHAPTHPPHTHTTTTTPHAAAPPPRAGHRHCGGRAQRPVCDAPQGPRRQHPVCVWGGGGGRVEGRRGMVDTRGTHVLGVSYGARWEPAADNPGRGAAVAGCSCGWWSPAPCPLKQPPSPGASPAPLPLQRAPAGCRGPAAADRLLGPHDTAVGPWAAALRADAGGAHRQRVGAGGQPLVCHGLQRRPRRVHLSVRAQGQQQGSNRGAIVPHAGARPA